MTAYEQAQAKLRELAALGEAGTPGPWRLGEHAGGNEVWANRDAAGWDAFMVATTATRLNPNPGVRGYADADLIVAAVNHLPGFVALCEGVLDRHAPQRAMNGVIYCLGGHALATRWSDCPDARAVLTALGVLDRLGTTEGESR